MQKLIVAFVLVAALALAEAARIRRDEKYTTKFDNVNIDDILASDRLVSNYVKCLLDQGKCTPDAAELKANLADALQHDCSKCSKKQKDGSEKVIKHLYSKRSEDWKQLTTKYDPQGVYVKKYEVELKKIAA